SASSPRKVLPLLPQPSMQVACARGASAKHPRARTPATAPQWRNDRLSGFVIGLIDFVSGVWFFINLISFVVLAVRPFLGRRSPVKGVAPTGVLRPWRSRLTFTRVQDRNPAESYGESWLRRVGFATLKRRTVKTLKRREGIFPDLVLDGEKLLQKEA